MNEKWTKDVEVFVLDVIVRELLTLDEAQRARTLRYLNERFGPSGRSNGEEPEVQEF